MEMLHSSGKGCEFTRCCSPVWFMIQGFDWTVLLGWKSYWSCACLSMLQTAVLPAIQQLYGNEDFYFQEDGAPHISFCDVRCYFGGDFSKLMDRGNVAYTLRSSDLTPFDFLRVKNTTQNLQCSHSWEKQLNNRH